MLRIFFLCTFDVNLSQIYSFELMILQKDSYRYFQKLNSFVEIIDIKHFIDELI
jgi:hypothetical protein